jgi:hypothetical protein
MNTLYFTLKDRKSLKTLRIECGQLGLKFVLRMFEGQIDRGGEREELPKEILFEGEQELLKRVHEIKKRLETEEWSQRESQNIYPTVIPEEEQSRILDLRDRYKGKIPFRFSLKVFNTTL